MPSEQFLLNILALVMGMATAGSFLSGLRYAAQ
jgi:hypothetical protein